MARNYYFFVAGLPDLLLDESKNAPSFGDFFAEAEEQLASPDVELLRLIRLPFDNENLVALLEGRKRDLDPHGNFNRDRLAAGLKDPESLPGYMQKFLESHRENRPIAPGLTVEDQLAWFFFDDVLKHSNAFIRDWFTFELNLRNVLAGLNSRKGLEHLDMLGSERERTVTALVVGQNDVAEAVLRSNAPDFGLGQTLPWLDRVMALSRASSLEFEMGIDSLRWDVLNGLTTFSYFSIETIAAFTIKLLIVERWMKLDAQVGKGKLDRLIQELESGYKMPEGF